MGYFTSTILANAESSSISGSDSESDHDTGQKACTSLSLGDSSSENGSIKLHITTPESDTVYSLHKCLIIRRKEQLHSHDVLMHRLKQLISRELVRVVVIMLSSGHFAAAVFENETVLVHKTFHK